VRPPKPSSALEFAVDALAVSRIVRLIQVDEIPVGAVREKILDEHGDKTAADLLTCPWCLSVWVSAGVAIARLCWPRAWSWVARGLAASAVTGHLAHLGDD
jgi:hypothetical protein